MRLQLLTQQLLQSVRLPPPLLPLPQPQQLLQSLRLPLLLPPPLLLRRACPIRDWTARTCVVHYSQCLAFWKQKSS